MTNSEKELCFDLIFQQAKTNVYQMEKVIIIDYVLDLSISCRTNVILCKNMKDSMTFNDYRRLFHYLISSKFYI